MCGYHDTLVAVSRWRSERAERPKSRDLSYGVGGRSGETNLWRDRLLAGLEAFEPILEIFADEWDGFAAAFEGADESDDPEDQKSDAECPANQRYPKKKATDERCEVESETLAEVKGGLLVFWVVCDEGDYPADDCDVCKNAACLWIHFFLVGWFLTKGRTCGTSKDFSVLAQS